MRRAAVVLICSLAALLIVGGAMMQSLLVMQRIAAVSDPVGKVEVRPRGANAFAILGGAQHVMAGDVVRTGADGAVTLNWVDGNRVRLSPNTTLEVLKCQVNKARQAETYLFKLDVGQIWVRVLKTISQQSKFEISTPTATAAVRGTIFSVTVDPGGATKVAVVSGQVDVASGDARLAVRERKSAAVGPTAPGAVSELTPQDQAEWKRVEQIARPALEITEPAGEALPAGAPSVLVRGVAERGARVTVNGKTPETGLLGRFEVEVPIAADAKDVTITITATDTRGYASTIVKRLHR